MVSLGKLPVLWVLGVLCVLCAPASSRAEKRVVAVPKIAGPKRSGGRYFRTALVSRLKKAGFLAIDPGRSNKTPLVLFDARAAKAPKGYALSVDLIDLTTGKVLESAKWSYGKKGGKRAIKRTANKAAKAIVAKFVPHIDGVIAGLEGRPTQAAQPKTAKTTLVSGPPSTVLLPFLYKGKGAAEVAEQLRSKIALRLRLQNGLSLKSLPSDAKVGPADYTESIKLASARAAALHSSCEARTLTSAEVEVGEKVKITVGVIQGDRVERFTRSGESGMLDYLATDVVFELARLVKEAG